MKKLSKLLREISQTKAFFIFCNLIELLLFLALLFGFFTKMADLPLGALMAIPFINLYLFMLTKSVDRILEIEAGRGVVIALFLSRFIVLLLPLIIGLILWYNNIKIFNPIITAVAIILFRGGIFIAARKGDI